MTCLSLVMPFFIEGHTLKTKQSHAIKGITRYRSLTDKNLNKIGSDPAYLEKILTMCIQDAKKKKKKLMPSFCYSDGTQQVGVKHFSTVGNERKK